MIEQTITYFVNQMSILERVTRVKNNNNKFNCL